MDNVERLKRRLDALRPLARDDVPSLMSLWHAQTANYVQASNAIEGNTLTVGETLLIIDEDRVVPNKSMTEHMQAINGARAFRLMLDMAKTDTSITLQTILDLHAAVEAGQNHAGKLRDHPVYIGGSRHVPPNYVKVSQMMNEALDRFRNSLEAEHPVVTAAKLHFDLVTIHPFADGNGRTSRLTQNLALIESGYPPVLIHEAERARYFDILQASQLKIPGVGDPTDFIDYCIELQGASLEAYMEAAEQIRTNREPVDPISSSQTRTTQKGKQR